MNESDWDESDWSAPSLYGEPIPLPGDMPALAVTTAHGLDQRGNDAQDAWSAPIYHGRRRHRPRNERVPATPGPVEQLSDHEQLFGEPTFDSIVAEIPGMTELSEPLPLLSELSGESRTTVDLDRPTRSGAHRGQGRRRAAPSGTPSTAPRNETSGSTTGLLENSRTMAIASLASRITGFLRTIALAAALGSGIYSIGDAYNLANTLPNMVYELLLGGVLTSVIVPVLVKAQRDDADQGVAYTQRLLSIATAGLGAATLLAVVAAPWLVGIFGGPKQFHNVAALWATLLLPEIFFYGMGAMLTAMLNTRNVYGWPAWAPVLNNIITMFACVLFALVPGPAKLSTGTITNTQIVVLGVGTTLGIVAQSLVLFIPLRQIGFHWKWRFAGTENESGRMAEFRTLTLWVLGYVAVSQLGVFAINRVATHHGAVSIFAYADLLFQVPYGILGVSLLTALMPRMSRAAAGGDTGAVLDDLRLGARLSSVALLPVTGALIVLGPALTSVILLGRFSTEQARLTGFALAAGAFGLLPFALVMLQQRVFYAMRDAKTPTFINISMVTVKVGLVIAASQLLHGDAVIIALTVATSASYVAGAVSGHLFLRRRFGNVGFRSVLRTVGWVAIAAFAATLMALFVVVMVGSLIGISRGAGLIELVAGAGLGGAVLITVAHRLPLPEVAEILAAIGGRRFSRPE